MTERKGKGRQYSLATAKDFTKELVAATPSQRNWKGILIALLVICAVCGLIGLSIYLLRPPDDGPRVKGRKITLANITSNRFTFQPFNGSWISDNELLFRDYLGGLSVLNAATLVSRRFVSHVTVRELNAQIFSVSSERRFILFVHDVSPVWKHSYLAKYTVYDIANEIRIPVSPFPVSSHGQEHPELQYATWSPVGDGLFFVYRNDIYYKPDPGSSNVVRRITNTGAEGLVFNGIPDWIYEEEILGSQSALWLSPDGDHLLYASFNDSIVGESVFSWYGDNLPYPKLWRLRYPKAGTDNPEVSLWLVDVRQNLSRSVPVPPPTPVDPRDYYLSNAGWVRDDAFTVIWMNRRQTVSVVSLCRAPTYQCEEISTVRNQGSGWLDFTDLPLFSPNGSSCLLRVPLRDGDAGLFRHIVWLDVNSRKEIPITHGPYEVTQIAAWDHRSHFIYFIAAPEGKPGERHLFRIPEKSSKNSTSNTVIPTLVCLTCPSSTEPGKSDELTGAGTSGKEDPDDASVFPAAPVAGLEIGSSSNDLSSPSSSATASSASSSSSSSTSSSLSASSSALRTVSPCLYNSVKFSPSHKFFVRECWGPDVPTVTLHAAPSGRLLFVLNNNTLLKDEVASMGLPLVRTFHVEVSDGYHAPVRLFLPPGLRDDEEFKFPLVLHVAGSPGSQLVSEKWGLSWEAYLTSQKNYIVAQIDGRGTGFQGENIRHSVYRRLGTLEVTDQLEVMRYLKDHLRFIDVENIAVWGENYGGFLAALIMAHDTDDLFRCGIFVEPITRWEYYNTVYTERYMGMPNLPDNYHGYEKADVTRKETVDKLQNKTFLIIHGTADQKVHLQHTLHFTKELVRSGITFKEQIYPDEGHHLRGVRDHFYGTMEAFIEDSFDPMDFEDWEKASFLGIAI